MKKYKWNAKKCFGNLFTIAMVGFMVWVAISWLQICLFNTSADAMSHYSNWNFWTMFVK